MNPGGLSFRGYCSLFKHSCNPASGFLGCVPTLAETLEIVALNVFRGQNFRHHVGGCGHHGAMIPETVTLGKSHFRLKFLGSLAMEFQIDSVGDLGVFVGFVHAMGLQGIGELVSRLNPLNPHGNVLIGVALALPDPDSAISATGVSEFPVGFLFPAFPDNLSRSTPKLSPTLARAQHQDLVDTFLIGYRSISLATTGEFEVIHKMDNFWISVREGLIDLTRVNRFPCTTVLNIT